MIAWIDKKWISGKSYGAISFDSGYVFFPAWKLENWETFCITADTKEKSYKTFINDREVFKMNDYKGTHKIRSGNIFLLNAFFKQSGFVYPMEASVTDVNIWSRVLDLDQIRSWSECTNLDGGDFIDWATSDVVSEGVTVEEMKKTDICDEKRIIFMAFGNKLNFPQTVQFCRRLDGEVATTEDSNSAAEIKEAFERLTNIEQVRCFCAKQVEYVYSNVRMEVIQTSSTPA